MSEDKMQQSDNDIVRSCLDGNKEDFSLLIDRYKNLVYSIISKMTCNADEYADIAQDIFIKIYKSLGAYDPGYKLSTWITRISVNHIIDLRRKKHIEIMSLEEGEYAMPSRRSAEEEYIADERIRLLGRLINELPEMYRIPLVLWHKYGMSYADIASSLSIPISKVKNRIFRARRLLKDGFKEFDKNEMQ